MPLFVGSSSTFSGAYVVNNVVGSMVGPRLQHNAVESPTLAEIIKAPSNTTTTETVVPPCTQFQATFERERLTMKPPKKVQKTTQEQYGCKYLSG